MNKRTSDININRRNEFLWFCAYASVCVLFVNMVVL